MCARAWLCVCAWMHADNIGDGWYTGHGAWILHLISHLYLPCVSFSCNQTTHQPRMRTNTTHCRPLMPPWYLPPAMLCSFYQRNIMFSRTAGTSLVHHGGSRGCTFIWCVLSILQERKRISICMMSWTCRSPDRAHLAVVISQAAQHFDRKFLHFGKFGFESIISCHAKAHSKS